MGGGIANDMYNNDVGQGVVYAYEAYESLLAQGPKSTLILNPKT